MKRPRPEAGWQPGRSLSRERPSEVARPEDSTAPRSGLGNVLKLPVATAFGREQVKGSRRLWKRFALPLLTGGARMFTDSHLDPGTGLLCHVSRRGLSAEGLPRVRSARWMWGVWGGNKRRFATLCLWLHSKGPASDGRLLSVGVQRIRPAQGKKIGPRDGRSTPKLRWGAAWLGLQERPIPHGRRPRQQGGQAVTVQKR